MDKQKKKVDLKAYSKKCQQERTEFLEGLKKRKKVRKNYTIPVKPLKIAKKVKN